MKLIDDITLDAAAMTALRRRIHAHPELGFEEQLTSELVAEQLQAWGIEVHRGLAKTGVVGLVHGRDGGACGGWACALDLRGCDGSRADGADAAGFRGECEP